MFWRRTVLPLVTRVGAALAHWLAPQFGDALRLVVDAAPHRRTGRRSRRAVGPHRRRAVPDAEREARGGRLRAGGRRRPAGVRPSSLFHKESGEDSAHVSAGSRARGRSKVAEAGEVVPFVTSIAFRNLASCENAHACAAVIDLPGPLARDGTVEGYASLVRRDRPGARHDDAGRVHADAAEPRPAPHSDAVPARPGRAVGVWLDLYEDIRGLRARGRLIPDVARAVAS